MRPQPGFAPHVGRFGQGPRKVLALHCNLGYAAGWAGMAQALAGQVTMIAPEMPSNGRSPDWDGVSDFAETVFVEALRHLTEPMDVIGHSFGGAVATRVALERPDLVRSLTIFESVFMHLAQLDAPDTVAAQVETDRGFMEALAAGDAELGARLFNREWSDGPRWPDLPEKVRAAMVRAIRVVPGSQPFLFDDTAGMEPRLGEISCPVLLMHGSQTQPVVKAIMAGYAARIPGAQSVQIAGAGHMAPITHAAEVARIWGGFLARIA